MFVVVSKIKEFFASKGMQSAGDFAEAASAAVGKLLEAAASRAEANGRKTARPEDL